MISFLLIYMTRMIHYDILSQLNTNLISVNEFVSMVMTLNNTMWIMLKVIIRKPFKQNKNVSSNFLSSKRYLFLVGTFLGSLGKCLVPFWHEMKFKCNVHNCIVFHDQKLLKHFYFAERVLKRNAHEILNHF